MSAVDFVTTKSVRPLVFISCGQSSDDEKALGHEVESVIRDLTQYEPYFAEAQNSLDGLSANILSALNRCSAFIGVMHRRGDVQTRRNSIVRGSVWVEQELAIAAFIYHALQRPLEVALYIERGIQHEGMRQQLRLKPVEFTSANEVLDDLRERVATWNLTAAPTYSLVAEYHYRTVLQTSERHEYRFCVFLHNTGTKTINHWRARVQFPTAYLNLVNESGHRVAKREEHTTYEIDEARSNGARFYPGDRKNIWEIGYHVDDSNRPENLPTVPQVLITVWTEGAAPWTKEIPMSELEQF